MLPSVVFVCVLSWPTVAVCCIVLQCIAASLAVSVAFCCCLSAVVCGSCFSADICAYVGSGLKCGKCGGYVDGTRGREKERVREDERASETKRVYMCVRERA